MKLLFFFLLISKVAFCQMPSSTKYPKINGIVKWLPGRFDSFKTNDAEIIFYQRNGIMWVINADTIHNQYKDYSWRDTTYNPVWTLDIEPIQPMEAQYFDKNWKPIGKPFDPFKKFKTIYKIEK